MFDDRLFSIGVGGFHHVGPDGSFSLSHLKEDPEGRDEVCTLVDGEGLGHSVRTNTIKKSF